MNKKNTDWNDKFEIFRLDISSCTNHDAGPSIHRHPEVINFIIFLGFRVQRVRVGVWGAVRPQTELRRRWVSEDFS